MKYKLITFIVIITLLGVPALASADSYNYIQLEDRHSVDDNKRFTVYNTGLNRADINNKNVYVLNENGYKQSIKVYATLDKKGVTVQPSRLWIPGKHYKLCIENGNTIYTFDFSVKKVIYIAK